MNTIPRMDDSLICRLLNVRIIGAGRLPKEDLQTIDDAIDAIKAATQLSEAEKLMDAAGLCKRCAAPVADAPIDMVLHCPACGMQHVDAPSPTDGQNLRMWSNPPHKSHLCRPEDGGCGHIWRPADVPTNGVAATKTNGKADSPVDEVKRPAELACGPDYKHMFLEAVQALANIDKLLGLPEDGCNDPQVTVSTLADFLAGAREAAQFRDHWVQSEPQPVQAQPSDVDFEAKTCPEAFLQQEISKLRAILATTVGALEMGLQIGDQCSRGYLAKFHELAAAALDATSAQPKPANQQKD